MALFKPFALCIGLRYTQACGGKGFVSFITLSAVLGIMLGVAILITVLSVMNGFDEAIQSRIAGMAHHITIRHEFDSLANWTELQQRVTAYPEVKAAAPFVLGQGMLSTNGRVHGVAVFGVMPEAELKVSTLGKAMVQGSLLQLQANEYGMVLGIDLAQTLGVEMGSKVTLITPQLNVNPLQVLPRMRRFTVVGLFSAGKGFGFDSHYAFIHLKDAQRLYNLPQGVTGLRLNLNNFFAAPAVAQQLRQALPRPLWITDWTNNFGALFEAIRLEKTMMFIILLMITTVAAFNLVATLVVVANNKRSDMAILRTLGSTPYQIMGIFITQGLGIGFIGMTLGVVLGLSLAWNITDLVNLLQHYLQVQFFSSEVYYVDYLPSKILIKDIVAVLLATFSLSLLAILYPAWRAGQISPAEALRYD